MRIPLAFCGRRAASCIVISGERYLLTLLTAQLSVSRQHGIRLYQKLQS